MCTEIIHKYGKICYYITVGVTTTILIFMLKIKQILMCICGIVDAVPLFPDTILLWCALIFGSLIMLSDMEGYDYEADKVPLPGYGRIR